MALDISQYTEQFDDLELENIGEWPVLAKVVWQLFYGNCCCWSFLRRFSER